MYRSYKVVAITPAGRQHYMEVLAPYILRDRGLIDEWMIWVNTGRESDLAYLERLAVAHKGFVRLVPYKEPISQPQPQPWFFPTACDPGTVYVKLDDDICWVKEDALLELVRFRIDNPSYFSIFSNTINNGFCAYIHAKQGAQSFFIDGEYKRISPACHNLVWQTPRIAEYVHRTFLDDLLKGDLEKYLFEFWELTACERFAINCIAWFGKDMAETAGDMGGHHDEEAWISTERPKQVNRHNCICGTSLVSHFAFYKQRKPHCVGREIDDRIHRAYRILSYQLGGIARLAYGLESLPPCDEAAVRASLQAKVLL